MGPVNGWEYHLQMICSSTSHTFSLPPLTRSDRLSPTTNCPRRHPVSSLPTPFNPNSVDTRICGWYLTHRMQTKSLRIFLHTFQHSNSMMLSGKRHPDNVFNIIRQTHDANCPHMPGRFHRVARSGRARMGPRRVPRKETEQ